MNEKTMIVFSFSGQLATLGELFTDEPSNDDLLWTRLEEVAEALCPSAYDAYEEGRIDGWDLMNALGESGMREVLGDYGAMFLSD
jgi:hypothetical protein